MSTHPALRPIRRLLIANRGEIAVRIIAACREAGIQPIAVYSEADRDALHVRLAGEAHGIGPAPAADSYLNQNAILAAARASKADAIHPGYGFLAENAEFAEACRSKGFLFIGPPVEAMRLMADKAAAKPLAREAGVPVAPGYDGEEQSDARLMQAARKTGFPLMVKAALGGGGKGMHVARAAKELPAVLAQSRREAAAAFGNDRLLLERLVARPRHIEVQILGDAHGTLLAIGERECSIQRRHQKIIEESPSPAVDEALRDRLCGYALSIAHAAGYSNAGTVEFLVDGSGEIYFLEMNTRLQVEHAVTEFVYGVDLVRLQIEIAAGEPLRLQQSDLAPRGHAIECRIYAEDPQAGFLPSTGPVLAFHGPEGPGIRNDIGSFAGDEVGPYYDPLLAKLTVHAADRAGAVERMREALAGYTVLGLRTNLEFLQRVVSHPDFSSGAFDIEFLDRYPELAAAHEPPPECLFAATASEQLRSAAREQSPSLWHALGSWRTGGLAPDCLWDWDGESFRVEAQHFPEGRWVFRLDAERFEGEIERIGDTQIVLRSATQVATFQVARSGSDVWVGRSGRAWRLARPHPPSLESRHGSGEKSGSLRSLTAPMPGRVVRTDVENGDTVEPHQVLLVLEAMKMEHAIEAPAAGIVREVYCTAGDFVRAGAKLIDLDESGQAP